MLSHKLLQHPVPRDMGIVQTDILHLGLLYQKVLAAA